MLENLDTFQPALLPLLPKLLAEFFHLLLWYNTDMNLGSEKVISYLVSIP